MQKTPVEPQVGADIEVFLRNQSNKHVVPCVGKIKGTKDKPFRPPGWAAGFAVQEDNVMLEFNIPPAPYPTVEHNLTNAWNMINEQAAPLKLEVAWDKAEHVFTAKQLDSPQARTFGCEPDYDAYEGGRRRIDVPDFGRTRFCGGHIHLGGDFKCPDWVAALFAELFIVLNSDFPLNKVGGERIKWYGRPGVYRPKPYGIEYRTPNNQWANPNFYSGSQLAAASRCARYLTVTEATQLQNAFRGITWTNLRKYTMDHSNVALRQEISTEAEALGVTL